ncbi:MAG: hypothetical protein QW794_04290 [Thermosphaera sp.]
MLSNTSVPEFSSTNIAEHLRGLLRKTFHSLLGESAGEAVVLLLEKSLQQDLGRALWENPKRIYDELLRMFGEGTRVLMNIIISNINQECKLNIEPGKIMKLMCSENRSDVEELRSIIRLVVKSCGAKH